VQWDQRLTDTHLLNDPPALKPAQGLCRPEEAARMIGEGRVLLLAGTEEDLGRLPEGCWIGGTAGYFMTPQGCAAAGGQIFYADFTAIAIGASWRSFDAGDIHGLAQYYPENGFAILLLPGFSKLLGEVAGRIMEFDGLYNLPLMGWVSAVALEGLPHILPREARPKTFAGSGQAAAERAAVLYISLPAQYFAQLHIANLFAPGTGPEIRFLQPGQFSNGDCMIGGTRGNLARYIAEQDIDRRLPLVADHEGALLNVSILPADGERLIFLSPVSPALTYRFAEEVLDYATEFARAAAEIELDQAAHACICALHHHYAGLTYGIDGAATNPNKMPLPGPDITAPITFGQIAYTVLNQTLTCLSIGRSEEGLEDFAP
jgi:hypothetical protein